MCRLECLMFKCGLAIHVMIFLGRVKALPKVLKTESLTSRFCFFLETFQLTQASIRASISTAWRGRGRTQTVEAGTGVKQSVDMYVELCAAIHVGISDHYVLQGGGCGEQHGAEHAKCTREPCVRVTWCHWAR